jgi:hypothetical protein
MPEGERLRGEVLSLECLVLSRGDIRKTPVRDLANPGKFSLPSPGSLTDSLTDLSSRRDE